MWTIISNEVRLAVCDKTCAKQSGKLVGCSKSHQANHTAQLSFCLKFAPIVEKQNFVQNTVRHYPDAGDWRKIPLHICRSALNLRLVLNSKKLFKTARTNHQIVQTVDVVKNLKLVQTPSALVLFLEIGGKSKTCGKP